MERYGEGKCINGGNWGHTIDRGANINECEFGKLVGGGGVTYPESHPSRKVISELRKRVRNII